MGSGVYLIDPDGGATANAFLSYCDMDTDGGGWTMAYKKSAGVAGDPYGSWLIGSFHAHDEDLLDKVPADRDYANPSVIRAWSTFSEARVEIIVGQTATRSLLFSTLGTTSTDWFVRSKLIQSPWSDLDSAGQNIFSMAGDTSNRRSFFINRSYGGCSNDAGWLLAKGPPAGCGWEAGFPILYAPGNQSVAWGSSAVSRADALVVLVR
mgnify:FL=1